MTATSPPCTICGTTHGPRDGKRCRGLCLTCYEHLRHRGEHIDHPTTMRKRAYLLDELHHLGFDTRLPANPQLRNLAPRLDMNFKTLQRAYLRAHANGDI